jgi:hypothetical protein
MSKSGLSYLGDSQIMPAVTVTIPMPKGAAVPAPEPPQGAPQAAPQAAPQTVPTRAE